MPAVSFVDLTIAMNNSQILVPASPHIDHDRVLANKRLQVDRRITLAAFMLLLILATGLRLITYERFLPFQDRTDESVYQVTSLHRRGVEPNSYVGQYYASQPPGYIWLTMLMQPFVEWGRPWTLLADYLHAQRLLALLVGVLTTVLVIRLGWLVGGTTAAWFAGLIWGISPHIVDVNSQSLPDPFVYLTVAAALVMAFQALRQDSPRWLFGSLLMGITAIYFKYTPVYVLIPWVIISLILFSRSPRRMLPWFIAQGVIGAVCAWYLLVNYAALNLPNREVQTFRTEGLEMAFDTWRNFNNWWSATRPIGEWLFIGTVGLGCITYGYSLIRRWRIIRLQPLGILLVYCLFGVVMASSFTNVWEGHLDHKIRHVLPITVAVLGIWSASVAQIFSTLENFMKRQAQSLLWLPAFSVVGLTLLIIGPAVHQNIILSQKYEARDSREILWRWTDNNIPADGRIMTRDGDSLLRTWNRWWGGYDGKTPFDWWHEEQIPQNTPAEYVERGIYYFAITDDNLKSGYSGDNPEVGAFVEQLVHLKTIRADVPGVFGDTIHFYRMIPPSVDADAVFGERIILDGYDLQADNLQPGSTLKLRPYWQIRDYPQSNYSLFVQLYPADEDRVLAQHDGPPAHLNRPTLTWDDLDEFYTGSDVVITLPEDLPPGDYRLVLGLYDYLTGQRLLLPGGESYFTIDLEVQVF